MNENCLIGRKNLLPFSNEYLTNSTRMIFKEFFLWTLIVWGVEIVQDRSITFWSGRIAPTYCQFWLKISVKSKNEISSENRPQSFNNMSKLENLSDLYKNFLWNSKSYLKNSSGRWPWNRRKFFNNIIQFINVS